MIEVVLDTSILLLPAERKLDVFEECRRLCDGSCSFAAVAPVLEELKAMASRRSKEGTAARIALQVVGKNGVRSVDNGVKRADAAMLALAREAPRRAFATTDAPLRRKLSELGAKVICLKGEAKLDWC